MSDPSGESTGDPSRRVFLGLLGGSLQILSLGGVALAAARYLLAPFSGTGRSGRDVSLMALDSVPVGLPIRASVVEEREDSYFHHPAAPVGTVWVHRTQDSNGRDHLQCLQAMCPHLGCALDFRPDRRRYTCPCHASDFDVDGRRLTGPSPRDMDELSCRIDPQGRDGRRWVVISYQTFRPGASRPIPR